MTRTKNSVLRLLEETPEAAYWVGLFFADGSISDKTLKFYLGDKDAAHALLFRDWLDSGLTFHGTGFKLQDEEQVRNIRERFDLRSAKTYNPPRFLPYSDPHLLRCWLVGFIDGDGSIKYQTGRRDVVIDIVSHNAWSELLTEASDVLAFGKLRVREYTRWTSCRLADNIALKTFALENSLPMMLRKWNRIDTSMRTRAMKFEELKPQALEMISTPMTNTEIATALGCSPNYVYKLRKLSYSYMEQGDDND